MKPLLYLTIALSSLCSCRSASHGLRQLTSEELYQRAQQLLLDPDSVKYVDAKNRPMSLEQLNRVNRDSFALDKFADKTGTVRLKRVRPIKEQDLELRDKIKNLYDSSLEYRINFINLTVKDSLLRENALASVYLNLPVKSVAVNCDSASALLRTVMAADQANRQSSQMDSKIDYENQVQVVSILQQCAFPDKFSDDPDAAYSVFLIVQHAHADLREQYFPLLNKAAEMGLLEKRDMALMEDRMLVDRGGKQVYGTQVQMNSSTGKYEVSPIEDPSNVDERRAAIGLPPIQEYLGRFGINWKEYIKEQK